MTPRGNFKQKCDQIRTSEERRKILNFSTRYLNSRSADQPIDQRPAHIQTSPYSTSNLFFFFINISIPCLISVIFVFYSAYLFLKGKHSVIEFGPLLNHKGRYNLLMMQRFSNKFGVLLKCKL